MEDKFNTPESPYTLTSSIFTIQKLPKNLLAELKTISDIEDIHIFTSYDFKYLQAENKGFISDQLKTSYESNTGEIDYKPKVMVFSLEDTDYQELLIKHGLNELVKDGFLLLDKTTAFFTTLIRACKSQTLSAKKIKPSPNTSRLIFFC